MTRRLVEPHRAVHADLHWLEGGRAMVEDFASITLNAPVLWVDTTSGYRPSLDEVVAFAAGEPAAKQ